MTRTCLAIAILSVAVTAYADTHVLEIEAAPASAVVSPSQVRRNTLRLPPLEYSIRLKARCGESYRPLSAALTIADTRHAVPMEALQAEGGNAEVTLTVPANQLSPIPIAEFCQNTEEESQRRWEPLTLRGMLSAGASLTCGAEDQREITYASAALDVQLSCEADESED